MYVTMALAFAYKARQAGDKNVIMTLTAKYFAFHHAISRIVTKLIVYAIATVESEPHMLEMYAVTGLYIIVSN